nr:MAG TPA: hypothetical protein [Caudoviricetes sp.]
MPCNQNRKNSRAADGLRISAEKIKIFRRF